MHYCAPYHMIAYLYYYLSNDGLQFHEVKSALKAKRCILKSRSPVHYQSTSLLYKLLKTKS